MAELKGNKYGTHRVIEPKGVLTQVFVDDDNNVILSQIHTYVAQVDGGYDEENEELELDDLGLDTFLAVNTTLSACGRRGQDHSGCRSRLRHCDLLRLQ